MHPTPIVLAVLAAAASSLAAQQPPGLRVFDDADFVLFDAPGDGSLWAATATYKLGVDAAGATFVPFFGSRAPRNHPIAFRLAEVRLGADRLALRPAAPTRDGHRIDLDRGAVVESYELTGAHAEQLFRFVSLPCRDELVVSRSRPI